ncbi:FliM/FliN family flagellar motor switch protein [Paraneptunicella aestuarii]|uniref:FliM/FliN family flagellar motor C-terminal domain-containing protein n=1 Tax=Paraneptunicella aestuarii TaxID=2831148 RepID=UPI001E2FAB54|nr:FliM/FliN family flagellar motor C-terminal domain-containing protein [Paraneptunicella aestuarii]UAA37584.1 FliM/FliN family flagellar motor switch protein [Paraneptunicella aestuarii]
MRRLAVINQQSRKPVEFWLHERLNQWIRTWFVSDVAEASRIEVVFNDKLFAVQECLNGDCLFEHTDNHSQLVISNALLVLPQLAMASLGFSIEQPDVDCSEPVLEILTNKLIEDLLLQLGLKGFQRAEQQGIHCSYGVTVCMNIAGCEIKVLMSVDVFKLAGVYEQPEYQATLISRQEATKKRQVSFEAKLHGARLTLDELLNLKSGDVVTLNHPLDQSVLLKTEDSAIQLNAFLVKREGSKALLFSE